MRFSATDWSFYPKASDKENYYRDLRAVGYEAAEGVAPANYPAAITAGLKLLTHPGAGMKKGVNFKENHQELIAELKRRVEHCSINSIPYLTVFSGNRNGQCDKEGMQNCARAFSEVLPYAAATNVTLLFEMFNSIEHEDYQADSPTYGFSLFSMLESDNFRILYDIYHMEKMGFDTLEYLIPNIQKVAHIHLADIPDRSIPRADGNIKYSKIISEILSTGYNGFFGMEFIEDAESIQILKDAKTGVY